MPWSRPHTTSPRKNETYENGINDGQQLIVKKARAKTDCHQKLGVSFLGVAWGVVAVREGDIDIQIHTLVIWKICTMRIHAEDCLFGNHGAYSLASSSIIHMVTFKASDEPLPQ